MSAATTSEIPLAAKKQKNVHRLNRIFRKPKTSLTVRPWRKAEDVIPDFPGVRASVLRKLVEGFTGEEKQKAALDQDPPSVTQEELAKRAARFGLASFVAAGVSTDGVAELDEAAKKRMERFGTAPEAPMVVDDQLLKAREERFLTSEEKAAREAMSRRMERFGGATNVTFPAQTAQPTQMSEEDKQAIERRRMRFGL